MVFIAGSNQSTSGETALGAVDILAIETSGGEGSLSHGKYNKYSNKERFDIGKYASENGSAASVRNCQTKFPKLNESTARGFQKKV